MLSNVQQNETPPTTPQQLTTHIQVSDEQRHTFQKVVMQWIRELSNDNGRDGYIVHDPTSFCGKKTHELVQHTLTKSQQISTIRMNKLLKNNTLWHKGRRFFFFILELGFPLILSVSIAYIVFTMYTNNIHSDNSLPPVHLPENYDTMPFHQRILAYLQARLNTISNLQDTGELIGSSIGSVLHGVSQFGISILNSTFNISLTSIFLKGYYGLLAILYGIIIYLLTRPFSSFFTTSREVIEKKEILAVLEQQFLLEIEKTVERCIYTLLQTNIMNTFEHLLQIASKTACQEDQRRLSHMIHTYQHDYMILYITIISKVEHHVRKMELNHILQISPTSANFTNLMYRLIREANDEVAQQIISLNQTMLNMPESIRQSFMQPVNTVKQFVEDVRPVVQQLALQNI